MTLRFVNTIQEEGTAALVSGIFFDAPAQPSPSKDTPMRLPGAVQCQRWLGGLVNHYCRRGA